MNVYNLQVAFGSDFTEDIEEQQSSLNKQPRGSGGLTYLVDLSFRGLEMALRYPGYRVSINFVSVYWTQDCSTQSWFYE